MIFRRILQRIIIRIARAGSRLYLNISQPLRMMMAATA
jgi:hypothetical protein